MKQLRGLGLAALVTLMLLPVTAEAGRAKTLSPEWVAALPAAAKTEQLIAGRAKTLSPEWVAALPAAAKTEQLIVVGGMGKTTAWVSMHQKDKKGSWHQVMTTPGFNIQPGCLIVIDSLENLGKAAS